MFRLREMFPDEDRGGSARAECVV